MGPGAKFLMAFDSTQAMMIWDLSEGESYFAGIQWIVFPIFSWILTCIVSFILLYRNKGYVSVSLIILSQAVLHEQTGTF